MGPLGYIEAAKRRILRLGFEDSTTRLAIANLEFGLAKVLYMYDRLGVQSDVVFVALPDLTITRSNARWRSGFSYGGLLIWGDGTLPLVLLDPRPNTCGTLVGRLDEVPDLDTMIERIDEIASAGRDSTGLWDFSRRNHFLAIYKPDGERTEDASFYFFLHGCPDRAKAGSDDRRGLSIDRSTWLQDSLMTIQTPFGDLHLMKGDAAYEYNRLYERLEADTMDYRIDTAKRVFGSFETISNVTHMGLASMNTMLMGCYLASTSTQVPFSTTFDAQAYLLRPTVPLDELLPKSEVAGRLRNLLSPHMLCMSVIPHGSGYCVDFIHDVTRVVTIADRRYFLLQMQSTGAVMVISNVSELPFVYRPDSILQQQLRVLGCVPELHLRPLFSFKV